MLVWLMSDCYPPFYLIQVKMLLWAESKSRQRQNFSWISHDTCKLFQPVNCYIHMWHAALSSTFLHTHRPDLVVHLGHLCPAWICIFKVSRHSDIPRCKYTVSVESQTHGCMFWCCKKQLNHDGITFKLNYRIGSVMYIPQNEYNNYYLHFHMPFSRYIQYKQFQIICLQLQTMANYERKWGITDKG